MLRSIWLCLLFGAALSLPIGASRAQEVLISEFMAANERVLADEDGDYSDWIELYNPGDAAVNLGGWFLTDNATNKTKWRIPSVNLAPKGFLVIFASNKNRTNTSRNLHTSFALGAEGEYLGLIKPDGKTVSSEYAPLFPPQQTDISYGMVFGGAAQTLVASGAPARALVPTSDALGSTWTALGFQDSAWLSGPTGVGYERSSGYESLIGLDIGSRMYNENESVYIRIPFHVSDTSTIETMSLRMKYDDGFVAYLNGERIAASDNVPPNVTYNSGVAPDHKDNLAVQFEDFDVTSGRFALRTGDNVLAIHGMNTGLASSDFLMLPELLGFSGQGVLPDMRRYFTVPTPGNPNGAAADLGPRIFGAGHTPSVLNAGQSLNVTARVEPGMSDVQSVSLTYRVQFGPGSTLPMYDDGAHGDGAASDGVYGATIPAGAYTHGQMVRYFISARGVDTHTSRYPLFVNPTQDAEYLGTMVSDPSVVTPLPVLYWFVSDPARAEQDPGTRASVFYKGVFYDNIYVRLRGNTSRSWPKKNLKFDFNSGAYFQYDPNAPAVEEFNLQSTYSDKSYMRQVLSWETYRDAGVPYSDSFHVRVQQNGSFYSVAEWVEQPDERLLTRNGLDPDGALYKMESTLDQADWGWDKKTRLHEDNSDLRVLVANLGNSGTALTNYLFDNVDIPRAINYIAATTIMHDNDHPHKNYYVYRDTEGSGEWSFLPWDKDLTFGRNFTNEGGVLNDTIWAQYDPPSHPLFGDRNHPKIDGFWNRFIDALHREPTIRRMYLRRLRTLMDDLLQPPGTPVSELKFENRINELYQLIQADVATDKAIWPTYGQQQSLSTAVAVLKTYYLEKRRIHLFQTHSAPNGMIPLGETAPAGLVFGAIERSPASGDEDEEYIRLDNPTAVDADISGWTLSGEVSHTFKPGTVIPANGSLYVSPDARAFRQRSSGPTGNMGLFVQGNYQGVLGDTPGPLVLRTDTGAMITTTGIGMNEALAALRVAAGLAGTSPADLGLLDFVADGDSASVVDLADAITLMRLAAGTPQ